MNRNSDSRTALKSSHGPAPLQIIINAVGVLIHRYADQVLIYGERLPPNFFGVQISDINEPGQRIRVLFRDIERRDAFLAFEAAIRKEIRRPIKILPFETQ